MTPLEDAFRQLDEARQAGSPAQIAQALIDHASAIAELGYYAEAHNALLEAAAVHHELGNIIDECMCMQFASVVSRMAGDAQTAEQDAAYSLSILPEDHPLMVSGYREIGEARFAAKDALAAVEAYSSAIDYARQFSVSRIELAKILDRRSRAFMLAGMHHDALADLRIAQQVLMAEAMIAPATKLAIDQATLLEMMGLFDESMAQVEEAWAMAEGNDDAYALADLSLLRSTLALDDHDLLRALEAALMARDFALQATAAQVYVAAALAITELYDLLDDRHRAYEALAIGYVTLTDLVGAELSSDAFGPKLLEKREKWGADTFDAIKADYEAYRREQRQNE
jgi:hypothetical protein